MTYDGRAHRDSWAQCLPPITKDELTQAEAFRQIDAWYARELANLHTAHADRFVNEDSFDAYDAALDTLQAAWRDKRGMTPKEPSQEWEFHQGLTVLYQDGTVRAQ